MLISANLIVLSKRRTTLSCGCKGKKEAPEPDDPCPCGSGEKYKDCCGK